MNEGHVLMVPEESTGKMFCLGSQSNGNGGFDYYAMSGLFLQCKDYNTPTALIMASAICNGLSNAKSGMVVNDSLKKDVPLVQNASEIDELVVYTAQSQQAVEVLAHPSSYVRQDEATPPLPAPFSTRGGHEGVPFAPAWTGIILTNFSSFIGTFPLRMGSDLSAVTRRGVFLH